MEEGDGGCEFNGEKEVRDISNSKWEFLGIIVVIKDVLD